MAEHPRCPSPLPGSSRAVLTNVVCSDPGLRPASELLVDLQVSVSTHVSILHLGGLWQRKIYLQKVQWDLCGPRSPCVM